MGGGNGFCRVRQQRLCDVAVRSGGGKHKTTMLAELSDKTSGKLVFFQPVSTVKLYHKMLRLF